MASYGKRIRTMNDSVPVESLHCFCMLSFAAGRVGPKFNNLVVFSHPQSPPAEPLFGSRGALRTGNTPTKPKPPMHDYSFEQVNHSNKYPCHTGHPTNPWSDVR
eukprot:6011888-Amphidinium_carterae.1